MTLCSSAGVGSRMKTGTFYGRRIINGTALINKDLSYTMAAQTPRVPFSDSSLRQAPAKEKKIGNTTQAIPSVEFKYTIAFTGNREQLGNPERKLRQYNNLYVFRNCGLPQLECLVHPQVFPEVPSVSADKPVADSRPVTSVEKTKDKGRFEAEFLPTTWKCPKEEATCKKLQMYIRDLNSLHAQIAELRQKKIIDLDRLRRRNCSGTAKLTTTRRESILAKQWWKNRKEPPPPHLATVRSTKQRHSGSQDLPRQRNKGEPAGDKRAAELRPRAPTGIGRRTADWRERWFVRRRGAPRVGTAPSD